MSWLAGWVAIVATALITAGGVYQVTNPLTSPAVGPPEYHQLHPLSSHASHRHRHRLVRLHQWQSGPRDW